MLNRFKHQRLAGWAMVFCVCISWVAGTQAYGPEDLTFFGDCRLRLYAADPQPAASAAQESPPFSGSFRMRAAVRLAVSDSITAAATAQWDTRFYNREQAQSSDARIGEYAWQWDQLNPGKSEVIWDNIAWVPVSWSLGRTVLSVDDGLIFSGEDDAWLVDGTTFSYDTWPLILRATYAEVSPMAPETDLREFLFLHGSYEIDQTILRRQALYVGAFRMRDEGEPVLGGFRSTFYEDKNWLANLELAGETGARPGGESLLAGIVDGGLTRFWRTGEHDDFSLAARYTWAGGDPQPDGTHAFIPLMNYEDWGCVFSPSLSNIRIYSLTATWMPGRRWTWAASAYHYVQQHPVEMSASAGNFNNGGYVIPANGRDSELGTECDLRAGCVLNDWLTLELTGGYFIRGAAYAGVEHNDNASEIRLQAVGTF